jgi:predicted MFS family arabinose efflux permease
MTTATSVSAPAQRTAVTAVFFANGLGIGAWAAAIPLLKSANGLSDAGLSLALLGFAAGAVVSMPLTGWLAPRAGSGRMTWIGGLAFALALVLPPLAPGLTALIAAAVLLGASNGILDVSMNAHASQVERRIGRPIMSSFHAAFSIGGLSGAALGGLAATAGANAVLWMAAMAASVLTAGFAPDLGRGERQARGDGPLLVRPDRAVLTLCGVALICMMIEGAMADWSAVYLSAIGGATPAVAAAGYAAFSLAMALGRLFGDRAVHSMGGDAVVRLGAGLAFCGLALATLFPGLPAIPGFALVGFGLSNVVPAVFSAAGRLASSAAVGVAMAASAGYAGFLAGPPLIGSVATVLSLREGMALLAVAAIAVAVLAPAVRRTAPQPATPVRSAVAL